MAPIFTVNEITWCEKVGTDTFVPCCEMIFRFISYYHFNIYSTYNVFIESLDQSLRVVAYERLGELLKVLKSTVNKYEELDSTGILNAAENLINHIKSIYSKIMFSYFQYITQYDVFIDFNYECGKETVPPEIFAAINNLALAFSSR